MGGGTAMRAATKYGGIGVLSTGFRIETPVNLSARKVAKPISSGLVSLSSIGSDSTTGNVSVDEAVRKASWESAGNEDGFVMDKPRLVFGTFPTIQQTKEATSQLTDALDQVFLSSPKSSGIVHETKYSVPQESSVPKTAMQAFRLLKESPAVQNVVASIACDPNVWNAVMQNPDLMEFLKSEKQSSMSGSRKYHGLDSWKTPIASASHNSSEEPDALTVLLENMKVGLTDMVHYLTNLVQSWFSNPNEDQRTKYGDEKSTQNYIAGGSFMALAVMVIMVVVLKR